MNDIEALRRIKQNKNLTYKVMAAELGVPIRTLFRWLHKHNEPSRMAKEKISHYILRVGF